MWSGGGELGALAAVAAEECGGSIGGMIRWRDDYSVGVDSLDTDHKLLICMINQVEQGLACNEPTRLVGGVLDALADYTLYHFAREETLMRAAGFADVDAHAQCHDTLAAQVREIRARYRRNPRSISVRELLSFLNNWLTTHIVRRDQEYASLLADTGSALEAAEYRWYADADSATRNRSVAGQTF